MQQASAPVPLSHQDTGDELEAADTIHAVIRFLRVLRRKKQFIGFALLVTCALGSFYYLTADKVYQAQAQLLVTQSSPDMLNAGATSTVSSDTVVSTHQRLIGSSVVLEGAIKRLQKLDHTLRIDLAGARPEKWKGILRNNLSASAVRRTSIIELSYRSKSPAAAQAALSAIVDSYVEFIDKSHKDVSVEIASILQEELREKERELVSKQEQWVRVSRDVGDLGLRSGSSIVHPLVQRAVKLNDSLVSLREKRLKLQASDVAVRAAIQRGGDLQQHLIDLEPTVGRELIMNGLGLSPRFAQIADGIEQQLMKDRAELQAKSSHLGPVHPVIRALQKKIGDAELYLANYREKIHSTVGPNQDQELGQLLLAMIHESLAETRANEQQIEAEYDAAEAEAVKLNGRMTELQLVESELQRLRNWHDTLLNQIANIDLQTESRDIRVSIVGEPLASPGPILPRLSVVGLLSILSGAGIGVVFAYVTDLLEDRFQSPEELQDQVGVSVLAMIQKLNGSGESGEDHLHMVTSPNSAESEAFRTLRTSLALHGNECNKIAITSSEPGDGKTTVLANLAATYALAGKKTLLIDCDVRKPGLTRLFAMRGQGGVSQLLTSANPNWAGEVKHTTVENLSMIPAGARPQDPTELFTSQQFGELIAWAEANYDQVLVDCPPVVAASDAAIVGRFVDGLLMVVQPTKNHRKLVIRSVEQLASLGVQLTGIVLNHVADMNGEGYFGYGYGYGYGYGTGLGYGAEEEAETLSMPSEYDDDDEETHQAAA